jgi:hypothetical protein
LVTHYNNFREVRRPMLVRILTAAVPTAAASPPIPTAASFGGEPDTQEPLAAVRQVTALSQDVEQALLDGYGQAPPCVPEVGYRFVRSVAGDAGDLDVGAPKLVHAPDGSRRLVAVESAPSAQHSAISWDV